MIIIYIVLILLSAFPIVLTIWRIRRTAHIKKHGTHCNGTVQSIRTVRIKYTEVDVIQIEYRDRLSGQVYYAKTTSSRGKFNRGQPVGIAYLPDQPAKYALTQTKGGYTAMLVFCILVFLFVIFAVYKINEMLQA